MSPPCYASMLRSPTCPCVRSSQVFPAAKLYTPDNLRVDNNASATASLRDIVLPGGSGAWPTVGALRGKVLFFADPDYTAELESVCAGPATDPSPLSCLARSRSCSSRTLTTPPSSRACAQTLNPKTPSPATDPCPLSCRARSTCHCASKETCKRVWECGVSMWCVKFTSAICMRAASPWYHEDSSSLALHAEVSIWCTIDTGCV